MRRLTGPRAQGPDCSFSFQLRPAPPAKPLPELKPKQVRGHGHSATQETPGWARALPWPGGPLRPDPQPPPQPTPQHALPALALTLSSFVGHKVWPWQHCCGACRVATSALDKHWPPQAAASGKRGTAGRAGLSQHPGGPSWDGPHPPSDHQCCSLVPVPPCRAPFSLCTRCLGDTLRVKTLSPLKL